MKKYLITSRQYYSDTPAVFRKILHETFKKHLPDFALYRDKFNPDYKLQAEHFVETCRQFQGVKPFLHQDAKLARSLGADGVHLTSKQFDEIKKAKEFGLEVCISTHTLDELAMAQELCADYATFSPIFDTPAKGEAKGVEALKEAVEKFDIKIFALGGIVDEEHVRLLQDAAPYGFASIRYFYDRER